MRIKKAIKLLTVFSVVFAFGTLGTAWWSGSAKAEDTNKLQSQKNSRQRLQDGSNCTTGGELNNNTDSSNSSNTGNRNRYRGGNGNKSGVNKSKGKGNSK